MKTQSFLLPCAAVFLLPLLLPSASATIDTVPVLDANCSGDVDVMCSHCNATGALCYCTGMGCTHPYHCDVYVAGWSCACVTCFIDAAATKIRSEASEDAPAGP